MSRRSGRASSAANQPTLHPGRNLALVRLMYGVPAERLAGKAGLTKVQLSRTEWGQRSLEPGELPRLLSIIGALAEAGDTEAAS